MLQRNYKYDVALSFSGKDRELARTIAHALQNRGVKVFYDEWAKADLWGKDLFLHLHETYSAQARFCVPLLSHSYVTSKWTKHELKSAQERSLESEEEYILPIRIDDIPVPGLRSTITYINYPQSSADEIAQLIAAKLQLQTDDSPAPKVLPDTTPVIIPDKVAGFSRSVVSRDVRISEKDIIEGLDNIWPNSNPKLRYNFAREMGRYFGFKFRFGFGPVYTAWRLNNRVFLSTLPNVGGLSSPSQKTFEFELYGSTIKKLALVAEWIPVEPGWEMISSAEFHQNISGISADRSGCNMEREATIKVLEQRGVSFRFPVAPQAGAPERFCEWLQAEPAGLLFDWDRNPHLVDPGLSVWNSIYHEESGEGILLFGVQGGWSNSALYSFEDTLDLLLPTRYVRTPLGSGLMRICVHLSHTPPRPMPLDDIRMYKFDTENVWPAVRKVYAAIGRMIAAEREIPVAPPKADGALPKLDAMQASLFERAVESLGSLEYPEKVKDYPGDSDIRGWSKLHHSPYYQRIGVYQTITSFSFSDVVTKSELLAYIESCERT